MGNKDAEFRIHDTLRIIGELLGPVYGPTLRHAIDSYLNEDFSSKEVREISNDIAIGGWHPTGLSDTEKTQRHLRRAILLYYRVRGDEVLKRVKSRIKSKSIDALKEELKQIAIKHDAPESPEVAGETVLSDSFGLATAEDRERALEAVAEAKIVLRKAVSLISLIRTGAGPTRSKWEKWFGPFDLDRYRIVQTNLEKMNMAIHTKAFKLYYRGENWKGTPENDLQDGSAAQPMRNFGQDPGMGPRTREPGFIHVALGTFFFDHHTAAKSVSPDTIAQAGTILHELSHTDAGTKDMVAEKGKNPPGDVHMYGPTACGEHAKMGGPVLNKCVKNADSYRLFCEEFK